MRPPQPSNELQPGETVRHFEIVAPLGRGGMGVVYRARDRKLDREVALKFLPNLAAAGGDESQRFLREARVASALDHPNICTVHAIEESADGRVFIAMAAYDGETLRERLTRGPVPTAEWIEIALQICRGLAAAHSLGIVHRDIKPANLMITADGLVKILDFGLSKVARPGAEGSQLTRSGTILGTLAYLSPEQARGEDVGPATDLWSLGAVLYEMATGQLPFVGANDLSNLFKILHDEPTPPTDCRSDVTPEQEAIILRALAKDVD
ncbi:MAG: serine/threonine-protein kinase, partial [Acidobacteriota bacterium]